MQRLHFWILTALLLLSACKQGEDYDARDKYELLAKLSEQYEEKNLTEQQQECQLQMLAEAEAMGDSTRISEAHQRIAATCLVTDELEKATEEMLLAYSLAAKDSLDYRAQTLLMLCQIHLQRELADSARFYLDAARRILPEIESTDLYRMSNIYVLSWEDGDRMQMEQLIGEYLGESGLYTRAELLRERIRLLERRSAWHEACLDSRELLALTDSIADIESSETMAQIHALQHDQQLEQQRAELSAQRARHYLVIIVVLVLLLVASVAIIFYRRKARIAHARQLEAMQLAESAQAGAEQVQKENVQLQKLYYEHLYAIILPILNARRGKSGHIDLEEGAWELIERNTDSVIPGFTTKMRRNHPTLTTDDIRFCCLIMMRVPNAILADVYAIAPASVAVRKQRMKRKLDSEIHEQTLENYLNQYLL